MRIAVPLQDVSEAGKTLRTGGHRLSGIKFVADRWTAYTSGRGVKALRRANVPHYLIAAEPSIPPAPEAPCS